jgi:hypothetical protein
MRCSFDGDSCRKRTMHTYDLYGFQLGDLEYARAAIESTLKVEMVLHDSLYLGEYYLGQMGEAEIQIRRNLDPLDGELSESEFPNMRILLYVNRAERAKEIGLTLSALSPDLVLLRQKEP